MPACQTLDKLPLLRTSVLIALVMLLKTHLKNLYGLTEECVYQIARGCSLAYLSWGCSKCLKWVIGKKNAVGDKPATRRTGAAAAPLTWARLPFATRPLLTMADMSAQRDRVWRISFVPPSVYLPLPHPVLGNLERGWGDRRARRRFCVRRMHPSLVLIMNCETAGS
jgi:hypothetical protein